MEHEANDLYGSLDAVCIIYLRSMEMGWRSGGQQLDVFGELVSQRDTGGGR